jgi:phage baseplate assembly protein W
VKVHCIRSGWGGGGTRVGQPQFGSRVGQPQFGSRVGQPQFGSRVGQPQFGSRVGQPQFGSRMYSRLNGKPISVERARLSAVLSLLKFGIKTVASAN